MIAKERMDEMESMFWQESNDPETEEWRDTLTAEESALVSQWDARIDAGFISLICDIAAVGEV